MFKTENGRSERIKFNIVNTIIQLNILKVSIIKSNTKRDAPRRCKTYRRVKKVAVHPGLKGMEIVRVGKESVP